MSDYLGRMAALSRAAHEGQTRRGTNSPYADHPARVADEARVAGLSEDAQAAAYLHDVVEDCEGWNYDRLRASGASERTVELVRLLTKEWCAVGLGRDPNSVLDFANKPRYYGAIGDDPEALALKLLDRADNCSEGATMVKDEPTWIRAYAKKTKREFEMSGLVGRCTNTYATFHFAACYAQLITALGSL